MDKLTADLLSHSQWLTIIVFIVPVIVPFIHDKKHYSAKGVKGGRPWGNR